MRGTPSTARLRLLTVRFSERSREELIARYSVDVMPGGMLLRSAHHPNLALGSRVRLRFQLASGEVVLTGTGLVAWIQHHADHLSLGLHFEELSGAGRALFHDMLRQRRGARRSAELRWVRRRAAARGT